MFIPIKHGHIVLSLGLLWQVGVHAEKTPQQPMTLGDLIVSAKQQHVSSLRMMAPSGMSQTPANLNANVDAMSNPNNPVLWSLTGVNHQLVAEVIYNQQVHVLRLHEGDRTVGPWVIERYGNNGLQLVMAKNKKISLYLRPPAAGMTLDRYAYDIPTAGNTNLSGLGLPRPGNLASNSAQNLGAIMPPNVLSQNANFSSPVDLLRSTTGNPGQAGK